MARERKVFPGRTYGEVEVGEVFSDALTITEAHLFLACALFKDYNPLHADQTFAQNTIFGGRVIHGPLTAGIMTGLLGNYFAGTIIAFLEQHMQFKAPVRVGDTITTRWEVVDKRPTRKYKGGVVTLRAICRNQKGEIVAEGEGKILLSD